jgi:hypothetical protein
MDIPAIGLSEIPPRIINRILAEVGFPIISFEDLKITEQDALDLFIYPAMQKYFAYNPNKYKTTQTIQSNVKFEMPFPTDDTFGVLGARVSLGGLSASASSSKFNPFIEHRRKSIYGTNRGNIYDNPYYTRASMLSTQTANLSFINLSRSGNMEVDRNERVLRGFSTVAGELVVTWAQCSDKWKDVRFEHEPDVIDLAKAHVLRYFGMLRSQLDPNTGTTVNVDNFIARAEKIEEEIKEKWESKPKVVVLH